MAASLRALMATGSRLLASLLLLGWLAATAAADTIVSYSSPNDAATYDGRSNGGAPFAGVDAAGSNTANVVMAGVTALNFTWTGGGSGSLGTLAVIDIQVVTQTRDSGHYVQFGWSASPSLDLTRLRMAYGSSAFFSAVGPRQIDLDISINGGAFVNLFTGAGVAGPADPISFSDIDLSAFTGVTSAVFRIFPYDSGGQDLAFFNFQSSPFFSAILIEGRAASTQQQSTTAPVPEPATLLLVACAGAMLLLGRRRAAD